MPNQNKAELRRFGQELTLVVKEFTAAKRKADVEQRVAIDRLHGRVGSLQATVNKLQLKVQQLIGKNLALQTKLQALAGRASPICGFFKSSSAAQVQEPQSDSVAEPNTHTI